VPEYVLQNAAALGDKPAMIDAASGRTITYGQLGVMVQRLAGGLAARGLKKGEVLGIYCPNVPEYAVVFHAVARLGAINTTVNALYTSDELAKQLNDCEARYLVTVGPLLDKALVAAAQVPSVREVFVLGEAQPGATPLGALLQAGAPAPRVDIDPLEDLVVLPYSSGTTGLPKGVMLTHHNLVANMCQTEPFNNIVSDDVGLGILPFFHIYGMVVIMNMALHAGATIVTMPRFDLEQFLRAIQDFKVTSACLVPPIVLALAKHPLVDQFDLSHLHLVFSGAAPLGEDLERAVSNRLGVVVRQGYGLTETSPVTHCTPSEPGKAKSGAVGVPIPNTEVRMVDPATGDDVDAKVQGEIWIRGPQVMKGYLNRPDATGEMIDSEGWLHTGDVGRVDADGYLYILDRVKELIKFKGLQVAPAELEAVLLAHPDVADAAVIPSPDEEAGEVPKAFVVLKPSASASSGDLMDYVAGRVAPYKKIRHIEFVESIPKSSSGKILRRVLVQQERERIGSPAAAAT
jgi:acyl-CoA synthetase (AMP-forming)/AMP-acid ligase II